MVTDSGSPKTVEASSNYTPCFLWFRAAFASSHSNRIAIAASIYPSHTTTKPWFSEAGQASF